MFLKCKTISVALCSCNGEKYLAGQLESIIYQSRRPDEIIICDDCSSDNTIKILRYFTGEFPGLIKLFVNEKRLGTIKNFEKAISLTTGDFIFLSDQDDEWDIRKTEIMISFFRNHTGALLLFTDGSFIDQEGALVDGTLWGKWDFNKSVQAQWKNNQLAFNDLLNVHNKVTGATIAFRRKLKKLILPINVPANYWHDQWIALNAAGLMGLYFIEQPLIKYRIHSSQQVGISSVKEPDPINFSESITVDEFYALVSKRFKNLKNKPTILKRVKRKILGLIKGHDTCKNNIS